MHLQKIYTESDGETRWSGIRLLKLAPSRRHHFKPKMVDEYEKRGLATRTKDAITLHTIDGDMVFTIDHNPGRYCTHCGEALTNEEDSTTLPQGHPDLGKAAREHVAAKHKGKKSPDSSNPHGYKYKHYIGATAADSVPQSTPKAGA